jgi:hypothetical protein
MPSFFQFTQGTESRVRPQDSSPLLGRFRAVPPRPSLGRRRSSQLGLLADRLAAEGGGRGSVHVGYGALVAAGLDNESNSDDDSADGSDEAFGSSRWERVWQRWVVDLWVEPRQGAVKRVVSRFWSRYGVLVFLPAALVRLIPCPVSHNPPFVDIGFVYHVMGYTGSLGEILETDPHMLCW